MRLATLADGSSDGRLVVISEDGVHYLPAGPDWRNLLTTMERWEAAEPTLRSLAARLAGGEGEPVDPMCLRAPLPRSWQWLDGSAFPQHGELMQIAFNLPPVDVDRPLMYQGLSDRFYGPTDDVPFNDIGLGIDFEAEFGVIVDAVPMGVSVDEAARHIRLIVLINDWSLRAIAPAEMKTGFGWVQAKPPCSMAPFAVTPDMLGEAWCEGRVRLTMAVDWNGQCFGRVEGDEMAFSFAELVAHAARTRDLAPGTIIGSGTVSNTAYAERGSACISERRAIEIIATGAPVTPFMAFGDTVRIRALAEDGSEPFGAIAQRIVAA